MPASPVHVAPGSDRVRLAALAVDAATGVDGVSAADAGPALLHVTISGATEVIGALVVAEPEGRYSVDLGLRAFLVPLGPVADSVRAHVVRAATDAGLGERVGAISVTFHDVAETAGSA